MAEFKKNYFQRRTKDRGPKSNNRINSPEVQVIANNGENLGILNTNKAVIIGRSQYFFLTLGNSKNSFKNSILKTVFSLFFFVYHD